MKGKDVASFGEVFERMEKKYRISAGQRHHLSCLLDPCVMLDQYGKHTVTSIYFDTPDSSLICRSLEKPLYKEKLRVRYYGDPAGLADSSEVFVCLKKKFEGVVYKRRVRMTYAAARDFLTGAPYLQACESHPLDDQLKACESLSSRSIQIAREIRRFVDFHGPLQPSMLIACDRMAFSRRVDSFASSSLAKGDEGGIVPFDVGLRITFDENIRYQALSGCFPVGDGSAWLSEGELGSALADGVPFLQSECIERLSFQKGSLLTSGESIMEIKVVGAMPLQLVHALSLCDVKPTSFSKYGDAFKAVRSGMFGAYGSGRTHRAFGSMAC